MDEAPPDGGIGEPPEARASADRDAQQIPSATATRTNLFTTLLRFS